MNAKRSSDLKVGDLQRDGKNVEAQRCHSSKSLRTWIDTGKPADAPPLSPKGDPISKVRLVTKGKVNIMKWTLEF